MVARYSWSFSAWVSSFTAFLPSPMHTTSTFLLRLHHALICISLSLKTMTVSRNQKSRTMNPKSLHGGAGGGINGIQNIHSNATMRKKEKKTMSRLLLPRQRYLLAGNNMIPKVIQQPIQAMPLFDHIHFIYIH